MIVHDLINNHSKIQKRIESFEDTLKDLRDGGNWELNISRDTRPSVQVLWEQLQYERNCMKRLLGASVTLNEALGLDA